MTLRRLRFAAVLLAAVALAMACAQVLQLPQRLQLDAALSSAISGSLSRHFALVGGPLQAAAFLVASWLAVVVREQRGAWGVEAVGCLALAAASAVWIATVIPVNDAIATVASSAPEQLPDRWLQLRLRWELGHAASVVLQLVGFSALLMSSLPGTPRPRLVLVARQPVVHLAEFAMAGGRGSRRRRSV